MESRLLMVDLSGALLEYHPATVDRRTKKCMPDGESVLLRFQGPCAGKLHRDWLRGDISEDRFISGVRKCPGEACDAVKPEKWIKEYRKGLRVNRPLLSAIMECYKKGIKLAFYGDIYPFLYGTEVWKSLPHPQMTYYFFSFEMGLLKSDESCFDFIDQNLPKIYTNVGLVNRDFQHEKSELPERFFRVKTDEIAEWCAG